MTLETFQGTHILGASRGHLSNSVIYLFFVVQLNTDDIEIEVYIFIVIFEFCYNF